MKNKDCYDILNEFNKGGFANLVGIDFILSLARNIKKIEQEIEILESLRKPTDKYREFAKKVAELRLKFADKDLKTGRPVTRKMENGIESYVISDKLEAYNIEYEALKLADNNPQLIQEQEKKDKLFEEAIERNCEIKFTKIKKADLPTEMNFKQVYIIEFMID